MRIPLWSPALLALAPACNASHDGSSSSSSSAPFATASEQVAHGGKVFADHCARCHGASGEGSKKAPRLVGAGALPLEPRDGQERAQRFRTALDVAQFVTHAMPPDEDDRKKLAERDYWAVLAFALKANGVDVKEPVGPSNAGSIVLHP